MKDVFLYVIAKILYIIISPIGKVYTYLYYIKKEKEKRHSIWYMKAFITDVKANVEMGEFFEYFFAK